MKKHMLPVILLIVVVILLAGCGDGGSGAGEKEELRIVSLMPSNTEILFALGLGDAVVGVTDYCNYPPELEKAVEEGRIQRMGDSYNVNEELLVSLEPDLVLFGFASDAVERLAGLGIRAEVIYPKSLEETYASIRLIGELAGCQSEAEKLAADMEAAVAAVKEKAAAVPDAEKPRVLMLLDLDYLYVAGAGTLENELIAAAGGINVVEVQDYPQINEEAIINYNPDIILCSFPFRDRILAEKEAWKGIAAVQNEAVYDVDGDLINRPGPRLVQGLEQLYAIFYPGQ
ncbi:MAG: ABC transporter substrate-binding protein [Firmicutes bacterium]|jgi:iron complex transport system substrate-binding protein|nr:ABC transporter substrate-binding protein [Bacillota bacterium]HPU00317.1 helical backbone metal receptor [Bacillota bacterium]